MITLVVIINGHAWYKLMYCFKQCSKPVDASWVVFMCFIRATMGPTYVIAAFLLAPSKNLELFFFVWCDLGRWEYCFRVDVSRLFGVSPVSNTQKKTIYTIFQATSDSLMYGNYCVSSVYVAHDCCLLILPMILITTA